MFADYFELKLGDTAVKGRRMSVKEIRENWSNLLAGRLDVDTAIKLIRKHVRLSDGGDFDPEEMTQDQMKEVIAEMTIPKEGRGITDFIGLLS